ncbi:MAG: hypothetical protein RCG15_08365 [Candidatus Rickettsia vulgarisii]
MLGSNVNFDGLTTLLNLMFLNEKLLPITLTSLPTNSNVPIGCGKFARIPGVEGETGVEEVVIEIGSLLTNFIIALVGIAIAPVLSILSPVIPPQAASTITI